jgi:lactoylglutathione lyase
MFKMIHQNFNVLDLEKSLAFYREALELKEVRRINAKDGSFIIVYLGDGVSDFQLELTWLRDRTEPYDLGDEEFHLAFRTDKFEEAHALHEKMGFDLAGKFHASGYKMGEWWDLLWYEKVLCPLVADPPTVTPFPNLDPDTVASVLKNA